MNVFMKEITYLDETSHSQESNINTHTQRKNCLCVCLHSRSNNFIEIINKLEKCFHSNNNWRNCRHEEEEEEEEEKKHSCLPK